MLKKFTIVLSVFILGFILISCSKNKHEDLAFEKIASFYHSDDEFIELNVSKDLANNKVFYYYYKFNFYSEITNEEVISEVLIIVNKNYVNSFNLVDKSSHKSTYNDFISSKKNKGVLKEYSSDEFSNKIAKFI